MMKNLKNMALTFLCLFLSAGLFAQQSTVEDGNWVEFDQKGRTFSTFDNSYKGVKGTPFLWDSWRVGKVKTDEDKASEKLQLKIDIYDNRVMFKHPETGEELMMHSQDVKSFTISDPLGRTLEFVKQEIKIGLEMQTVFVNKLYQGKSMLFVHYRKEMLKASNSGAYNEGRAYDEFVAKNDLFVKKPDGTVEKIRLARGKVLRVFKDKKKELKKFIKQKDINFDDQTDLIRVVKHYDSLI